jgi:hypothetical protein
MAASRVTTPRPPDAPDRPKPERPPAQKKLTLTAITALVALATAGVGLVFDLWPGLRPDPRSEFQADVRVLTVEPDVSYADFLRRTLSGDDLQRAVREANEEQIFLHDPGFLVYVETTLRGFKRRSTRLRSSVYDAETNRRFSVKDLTDVFGAVETGEAPSDRSVQRLWIQPLPDPASDYFVRIEVYTEDEETLLAIGDSERFAGVEISAR